MMTTLSFSELAARAETGDAEAQYVLASALYQREEPEAGLAWLRRAFQAGHPKAAYTLGLFALDGQVMVRDRDQAEAAFRHASAGGLADADYRLAELAGFSSHGRVSSETSLAHLARAARHGSPEAARVLGFYAAESEAWEPARAWFEQAARADDGPAWHALGCCWLEGLGGATDPEIALGCFVEGAKRGQWRSREYAARLKRVPRALPEPSEPGLPEVVAPVLATREPEVLRERPRIYRVARAFSRLECDYLINLAAPRVAPSRIVHPRTGELRPDPVRTSFHLTVDPVLHDLVLERLELRLSAYAGLPVENGEFLSLLRYQPGQQYRRHFDYFNPADPGAARQLDDGGQRVQTLLVYLNDDFRGGATEFPRAGLLALPQAGDLLAFHNVDGDGALDPLTLHAGLPVESGTKWLASKWLRSGAYPPRLRW